MPFAGGPRMCIGRRFGETECVSVLAALLSEWKVELGNKTRATLQHMEMLDEKRGSSLQGTQVRDEDWMEDVTPESEAYERTRRREAIRLKQGLTLTPVGLGLVFRRRDL